MASITTIFTTYESIVRDGALSGSIWQNPTLASTEDGSSSNSTYPGSGGSPYITDYLKCSNLQDNVETGSTIDGIIVRLKRAKFNPANPTFTTTAKDESIVLDYLGSQSANKADTSTFWPNDFEFKTYGSASDTWSFSPSDTVINSDDFSLLIACTINTTVPFTTGVSRVDFVEVTIYYTPAGPPPAETKSRVFLIT